jgi:hypothetical protein
MTALFNVQLLAIVFCCFAIKCSVVIEHRKSFLHFFNSIESEKQVRRVPICAIIRLS